MKLNKDEKEGGENLRKVLRDVYVDIYKQELEYLRWLAREIDFGPAHEDVMRALQDKYEERTGMKVPKDWDYRTEEE